MNSSEDAASVPIRPVDREFRRLYRLKRKDARRGLRKNLRKVSC